MTIIDDAAHALGARRADGPVGDCRHVDMTVLSFHPVKPITTGEGGIVTTRDAALRDRLRSFRSHGMTKDPDLLEAPDEGGWYMEQHDLGFNYRLTDLQSALGTSQLGRLDAFIARRNAVAARYRDELADVAALALPPQAPPGARHGYHLFVVSARDGARRGGRSTTGCTRAGSWPRSTTCPSTATPGTAAPTASRPASARRPRRTTRAACRCRATPASPRPSRPS